MKLLLQRALIILLTTSTGLYAQIAGPSQDKEILSDCTKRTHIVLLGTGTPNPEPDKHGQAIAIVVGKNAYLVDCGVGIVRRAAAAHKAGVDALQPLKLNTVFITHLHSDHTLGYPDLVLTPWVLGRSVPLRAFGPKGLKNMTDHILGAYAEDIRVRIDGLQPSNDTGYKVEVNEINAGLIYKDNQVEVHAFPVVHEDWKLAYGFRFITPDLDICISGDTTIYDGMEDNYGNCDVLIHEVYSEMGFQKRPPDWQAYHRAAHTSAAQLGKLLAKANPGLTVLVHQLLWGYDEKEVLGEVAAHYSGRVVFGRDLNFIGTSKDYVKCGSAGKKGGELIVINLMALLEYRF